MPRQVQTSGTPKVKKPTLPIPNADELLKRFEDFPAIEVISRRFNDPNDPGSLPILLKDESPDVCVNSDHQNRLKAGAVQCHLCKKPARKWYVRYFNLQQEGRNAQMRAKGYVPVEIKELQDVDDIADLYRSEKDTYVRRGDRGLELLGKMPLELYNEIKRRQRVQRDSRGASAKARREERAEAAGRELGDEAGQTIYNGEIKEEYFRRGKTTLGAEAGTEDDE